MCFASLYNELKKKGCAFSFLEIRVGAMSTKLHRTKSTVKHHDGSMTSGVEIRGVPEA